MSEVWSRWEGQTINGTFPLVRCLGASDHSGVFLTAPAPGAAKAALKLVPAIPSLIEAQLSHWSAAASLSHPRLIRLFDMGRCQLGERRFLFVVMEYAEQNLAEVLPHRALTVEEVREMLLPTLDALSFLHSRQLVQGQLRPSNILVVGDQIKLASDTIHPAGDIAASIGVPSVFEAPETGGEIFSTAADIWALGVTLVEALTQAPPSLPTPERTSKGATLVLAPDFPPAFADIARRCLSHDPQERPSVADLAAWIEERPQGSVTPVTEATGAAAGESLVAQRTVAARDALVARGRLTAQEPLGGAEAVAHWEADPGREPMTAPKPRQTPPPQTLAVREAFAVPGLQDTRRRGLIPTIAGVVALLVAGWAGVHLFSAYRGSAPGNLPETPSGPPTSQQAVPDEHGTPQDAQGTPPAAPGANSMAASAPGVPHTKSGEVKRSTSPTVLHEEIPNVPRSARNTIHGHIKVAVRVTVDGSGTVVSDELEDPGPSHYFARLATQAARKWTFVPTDDPASRQWLVRFEFSRDGTTGRAARPQSR